MWVVPTYCLNTEINIQISNQNYVKPIVRRYPLQRHYSCCTEMLKIGLATSVPELESRGWLSTPD
jgi:hypothetical protein